MKTSKDLLREARDSLPKHDLKPSYYRLAIFLDVPESRMTSYRTGKAVIPDDLAVKLKKLLPYTLPQIMFWLAAERAKSIEAQNAFLMIDQVMSDHWSECKMGNLVNF